VWAGEEPLEFIQFFNRFVAEGEGKDPNSLQTILGDPIVACIGPITAETAREVGLQVDVEAKDYTVQGLVEALKEATG
jgi:uroporphyrinogen III methyltransferase/synthase